ncbi:MAG: hypothetical protein R3240_07495 [Gammaproteobacteria bacterium]|nr:hypothetical protein [Gammaproteobacteria bacterium]
MNRIIAVLIIGLLVYVSSNIVYAGSARDAGDQTVKKMQYMLRQISAEKDAALAEVAKLKKEVEKLEKTVRKSDKKSSSQGKKIERLETTIAKYKENNDAMRERILKDREKSLEMVDKFRETVGVLRQLEKDKSALNASLTDTQKNLDTCSKENKNMYQVNSELVKAYRNKGVFDALLEKEPFTGIKKVETEMAAEQKEEQLELYQFVANE